MNVDEILNFENYCALAVSVYGEELCGPEIAFERMGINVFTGREEINKYRWTLYGDVLWRDMLALRKIGWHWTDVAAYFGLNPHAAMTIYSRAKKLHTGKGAAK